MTAEVQPFIWKGKKLEKLDQIIAAALELKGKEQKEFVKAYCAIGPYARQNIGYCSGYYDRKTAAEIVRVFETAHPIFGTSTPTTEEAFELGKKLGEESRRKAK